MGNGGDREIGVSASGVGVGVGVGKVVDPCRPLSTAHRPQPTAHISTLPLRVYMTH